MAQVPQIRWQDQFATLYILVAGPVPLTATRFKAVADPAVASKFMPVSRRLAIQSIPIQTERVAETDEGAIRPVAPGEPRVIVESSFTRVTGGPFEDLVVRDSDRVMTGVKYVLRMIQPPATIERLASFRAGELRTVTAGLSSAGFDVQSSTIRPWGMSIAGDRGIPPTPALPPDPSSIVGLVIGGTVLLSALFTERLALQGRIPGLGVTDEEFLAAEEDFQEAVSRFDKAARQKDHIEALFQLDKLRSAMKRTGDDSDIKKQFRMRQRKALKLVDEVIGA